MKVLRHLTHIVSIFSLLTLVACGGGGGGDSSTTTPESKYTINGTVTGLAGTGLVLQNNVGDDLPVSAGGNFSFSTALVDGSAYDVTVSTQPTALSQTCTVANGSGTISGANITNVSVVCVTNTYSVSGAVTGLSGTGLVLQNNAGDDLAVSSNGNFSFTTALVDGSTYAVTVLTQPGTPSQTCTVTNGSGTISGANITNVSIVCVNNTYTVGGTVAGLAGIGLVLQNNLGDNLNLTNNGSFNFATALNDGDAYSVTVLTQPTSPYQICSITNGSGTISGTNVTNISVQCVTTPTYTISGNLSGLQGALVVLSNNGADSLLLNADGPFTFNGPVPDGGSYDIAVTSQPTSPSQICSVTNGNGTVSGANVTNIQINCVTQSFTIGGTVTGLQGSGLTLLNNGGDSLSIGTNGTFEFSTPIVDLNSYSVTVTTQPTTPDQLCSVTNDSGSMDGTNVTNVQIDCVTYYTVGGTVTGLVGSGLVLQNNGGNNLAISANGSFTFTTSLLSGSQYQISVLSQPSATEMCLVTNNSGQVAQSNVTNVSITCYPGLSTYGNVLPLYPSFGSNWLDYVLNDGTDVYSASDSDCPFALGVNPNYASCIHGGEKRSLVLTGITTCTGITAEDSLKAFDWVCDDLSGTAVLTSVGLKSGIGLSELIDYSTPDWAPNTLAVFDSGAPIGMSTTGKWWSNSVTAANDSDADRVESLTTSGIYVVTQDTDAWYQVWANKVGLVVRPNYVISYSGSCAQVANFNNSEYSWFEGEVQGGSCTTALGGGGGTSGTGRFQVYRNVYVTGGSGSAFSLSGKYGWASNIETYQTSGTSGIGMIFTGSGWLLEDLRASKSGWEGIRLNGLINSELYRVESRDNANKSGIYIYNGSKNNKLRDIVVVNNGNDGMYASTSLSNDIDRVYAANNTLDGIDIGASSNDNWIRNVIATNNGQRGIALSGDRIRLFNAVAANNVQQSVSVLGKDVIIANVTATNSAYDAFTSYANYGVMKNIAAVNSARAGITVVGDYTAYENIASAQNAWYGVWLSSASTGNNFTGNLKVGGNDIYDCYVESETASTSLSDDVSASSAHAGLCLQGSTSTFGTAAVGIYPIDSFVGKVMTDDLTNASDTNGLATYESITDWTSFDSFYRGWGVDGAAWPDPSQRDRCTSGNCRIWDWRLAIGDTGDGGSPVFLGVNPVPTGNDVITHAWLDGTTTTFLSNAVEIEGDGFGDDDILCEANEACLYTPNIGAYQGHGNLVWTSFTPGTITGVVLYRYESNGM
ncbi:right-handed parallel beta-helix repeat-containing protein [Candidatus Pacearchaeota archaeon]|nr:right-handed parallel beta-helix repeat-containing protein [Candidatus Pacearchaeota archaeon]